ncbi:MAG: TerB N-terminal domain-containing protein [Clostridia bacterium]|nr:TerB N-terminal domain-containing protein [Clostridia bacterium]
MKSFDDKDGFWSLESMLPPSAFEKRYTKAQNDVTAVEIEIEGVSSEKTEPIPKRSEPEYPPITAKAGEKIDYSEWLKRRQEYKNLRQSSGRRIVREYDRKSPLIKRVTVSESSGVRQMTERFLTDGKRLFNAEGEFTGNVGYQAVYPQYATMTSEQLSCYIGFRSEIRKGRYPTVDRAYVYLYLYELINLTDMLTPSERAQGVAGLICGYSECDDKLFSDMCSWLADICLIYGLDVPECIYGEAHPRVLKLARIKELFLKRARDGQQSDTYRLMLSAGRYDYRTSKFYPEFKEFYDKYIDDAVCYALSVIGKTDSRFRYDENNVCMITRESFFGAYRTSSVRYTVTVELVCVTHSDEEKRIVSELTKYAENCLRSMLSVKQRLTVGYINLEKKAIIKKYLSERVTALPDIKRSVARKAEAENIPEYEKLYEPRNEELSFEGAAKIEERSWDVTEKLVSAFDAEPEQYEEQIDEAVTEPTGELDVIISAIRLLTKGESDGFKNLAFKLGTLPDALADSVNEYLLDKIGDVAIECDGNEYNVASWYTDDINELLSDYGKDGI